MPFDNTANPVAVHLMRAKAEMRRRGRSPRGAFDGSKVCPLMAIKLSCAGGENYHAAIVAFGKAIGGTSIGAWADDPRRADEEMWAAWDRAADLAMLPG